MLTLLHAADFHLDSPFRALPPREAQARRGGQRQLLEALGDLALECHVDLALLPGDLFDSQQVYPETLEALTRTLGQFPCPVVIAPGNHDYYDENSPYNQPIWPGNVHIFTSETVTSISFAQLGVTVYGFAFTSPFRETDPLADFAASDDGTIALGVFHGQVGKTGQYAPISPDSLAQSGLVYAALGHVHAREHHLDAPTPWAYPGCPQGRGFDELGEKGCCLIQLDKSGIAAFEFVPLPGPRYWEKEADITGQDPAWAVTEALTGCEDDCVRLTLAGEADALDLPTLRALGEGLCKYFELRDETVRPQHLWERLDEDTLTGHFLREMAARLEAAEAEDRPLLERALRYGMAALEGREAPR